MKGNKKWRRPKSKGSNIPHSIENISSVPQPTSQADPKIAIGVKIVNWLFKTVPGVLTFIGLVIGIVVTIPQVRDLWKSDKEKFNEERFVTGEFKLKKIGPNEYKTLEAPLNFSTKSLYKNAPPIPGIRVSSFNDPEYLEKGWFILTMGRYSMTIWPRDLLKGVKVFDSSYTGCSNSKLVLAVKGDRLYCSVEFKDIQKEETIGVVEFDHWKLYKENFFDYYPTDSTLEVLDLQHNIVLSMRYHNDMNWLDLSGYFIDTKSVLIIRENGVGFDPKNECISKSDSDWKVRAIETIDRIRTAVPKKVE